MATLRYFDGSQFLTSPLAKSFTLVHHHHSCAVIKLEIIIQGFSFVPLIAFISLISTHKTMITRTGALRVVWFGSQEIKTKTGISLAAHGPR